MPNLVWNNLYYDYAISELHTTQTWSNEVVLSNGFTASSLGTQDNKFVAATATIAGASGISCYKNSSISEMYKPTPSGFLNGQGILIFRCTLALNIHIVSNQQKLSAFSIKSGSGAYKRFTTSHYKWSGYFYKINNPNGVPSYVPIYEEIDHNDSEASWSNKTALTRTHFQPYEPVNDELGTLSVTLTVVTSSFNSQEIKTSSTTTSVMTTNFGSYYTEANKDVSVTVYSSGYGSEKWTIHIDDWDLKELYIEKISDAFKIYSGIEIGNDFLQAFKVIYKCYNEYFEEGIITEVQSSLEKDRMSKKIISENDGTLEFDYDVSDLGFTEETISYSVSDNIIKLATGNAKFSNLIYKKNYSVGDVIDYSFDVKNEGGSLTYSDNTTISLSDIAYNEIDGKNPAYTSDLEDGTIIGLDTISTWKGRYSLDTTYFGQLQFEFDCFSQAMEQVNSIEFVCPTETILHIGDVVAFPSDAHLDVYDVNGNLIASYGSSELSGIVSAVDDFYGQEITYDNVMDGVKTLRSTAFGMEFTHDVYFEYNEQKLKIVSKPTKQSFVFDPEEEFEFDYSGLKFKIVLHSNSSSGTEIEKTLIDIDDVSDPSDYLSHDPINDTGNYTILISYTDEFGASLSNSFSMFAEKLTPTEIIAVGSDTTKYWSNDKDKFHLPNGVTFKLRYNNGEEEVLSDLTKFNFYRDEDCRNLLVTSTTPILEENGRIIYFTHSDYPALKVSGKEYAGSYLIEFQQDYVSDIELTNSPEIILGNLLESQRNNFTFKATYESGEVDNNFQDYEFTDNTHILVAQDISIKEHTNNATYTFDKEDITFTAPNIDTTKCVVNLNGMPESYNNLSDTIDARNVTVLIGYEDATYTHVAHFTGNSTLTSANEFNITCSDMQGTPAFDGTYKIHVNMGGNVKKNVNLSIHLLSTFDNSETATLSKPIEIIEITEIVGLSLVTAKTQYKVGDTFLNDEDNTEVIVWYKDTNNDVNRINIKLKDGLAALNIYPIRGTKFEVSDNSKTVTVSSASNNSVVLTYNITVLPRYVSEETKIHNLVALFQSTYTRGGKQITTSYSGIYLLVPSYITSVVNGERILNAGAILSDNNVFGYLDDCFQEDKNVRVKLFKDYLPIVDGSNNMTVRFPCYVAENAEKIDKCHFGILFGSNNASNRLFVSGNNNEPNADWHSSAVNVANVDGEMMKLSGNFSYITDTSVMYYGETDNSIVGYEIVSNDKLLVLKTKSDKEKTVYFRVPMQVSAVNGSGTVVTGFDGTTFTQEEFGLVKGNNSVAGISPNSIINFNGDTVFVDSDNQLVGLDLTGIIGDNQRYANTRSKYLDYKLKDFDLSKSILWSNNKYLFFTVPNVGVFLTHYEALNDSQYEWWYINAYNPTAFLEYEDNIYYGNDIGQLYLINKKSFQDINKIFVGTGGSLLSTIDDDRNMVIVDSETIHKLSADKDYIFKTIPSSNQDTSYMYYLLGSAKNVNSGNCDFYINAELNCLEIVGKINGVVSQQRVDELIASIREDKPIYLNRYEGDNQINCLRDLSPLTTDFSQYYVKYRLIKATIEDDPLFVTKNDCYFLEQWNSSTQRWDRTTIRALYRCTLCYKLDKEYNIIKETIDYENCSFKLEYSGKEIDLVVYATQDPTRAFKAEIKEFSNIGCYWITAPMLANVSSTKTIWSFTVTNDTNIPSELEIGYASNKIPIANIKTLASLSKEALGLDFNKLDYSKVDFDKCVVPRTYTTQRVLAYQKFICFAFRNNNNSNSVLSSMSVIYTVPYPSTGGD